MIIAPAIKITFDMISASNISATSGEPSEWDGTTAYSVGDQVVEEYAVYESRTDNNLNNIPPQSEISDDNWFYVRSINRMKPFEHDLLRLRLYDQCSNSDAITFTVDIEEYFDAVGFFNLDADTIEVEVYTAEDGTLYSSTAALIDNTEIIDAWTYELDIFDTSPEKVFSDLEGYSNVKVDLTISKTGGVAKVGQIAFARQRNFGRVVQGTTLKSENQSTIEKDFNGVFTSYRDRGSIRTVEYRFAAETKDARRLQRIFHRDIENKPAMFFMGDDTDEFGTTIFGIGSEFIMPLNTGKSFATLNAEEIK